MVYYKFVHILNCNPYLFSFVLIPPKRYNIVPMIRYVCGVPFLLHEKRVHLRRAVLGPCRCLFTRHCMIFSHIGNIFFALENI